MHYKQVRLREETYNMLLEVVNELQRKRKKKVSFSDAIEYLIKLKNKKVEVKL